ncbi:MAG TPA: helicase-exonuclease AddAB subunit AddA [Bacillota bacterium]|nr:helicase-exonuclease AddAB subunit AddA [Bacillota bacterium]
MIRWTDEQQEAIDSRDCNLLVAAAAGSGKTAVLVERILQLIIKDKVSIDTLLVVTFTNAAAGEMRERIGDALAKALDKGHGDPEHLRQQMSLLPGASISTLHSFCISVIRRYFYVIDLDPGFRIGDEAENSIIKLEVMEDLFEREYEKAVPEFLGLLERFGGNRDDEDLKNLVESIYSFIQSKPNPLEWLKDKVEEFSLDQDEMEDSSWCRALRDQTVTDLKGLLGILDDSLRLCQMPNGPEGYQDAIISDKSQLQHILMLLEKEGLKATIDAYSKISFKRLAPCKKDTDETLKTRAKKLRDGVKKAIGTLGNGAFTYDMESYTAELNELYPYMDYLYKLVEDFHIEFTKKKQDKGILDFNDLEHHALRILADDQVAAELQQKYSHIFTDEYQDSNIVQETILGRIRRENNFFMVGDVKQSIYRFRLADPTIFLSKYQLFKPGHGLNRRVDLNKNFRSRPHILDGVNYLFENIMSADFGQMDYDEEAALYQGGEFTPIDQTSIEVNLLERQVKTDSDAQMEVDPLVEDMSDVEVEALLVANRIKHLLEEEIFDKNLGDKGGFRKIEYRDIVILMRSTVGRAPVFQEILSQDGIPVFADINTGYFGALEIKTMVNLLKVVDNKQQDIPLLSVLRSPIGGFSAQELIDVRIASPAKTFYEAVLDYIGANQGKISDRLKGFFDRIGTWQQYARYMTMEDFLWKLYMESGYYYYVGAMPGGIQRQANLRLLLDRAGQFQQTSIKGLFRFIHFIDKLTGSSGDMRVAKALGENENLVRIMSVHKSKGLEYPICIVTGLGKRFNMRDSNAPFLVHKDLGLGPKYTNPETRQTFDTIAKSAIKQASQLESLSEEMRILYVALTRAKDRLILIGSAGGLDRAAQKWANKLTPYTLSRGTSYLDWICPVLMRHEDGACLRDLAGQEDLFLGEDIQPNQGPSSWHIKVYDRSDISSRVRDVSDQKNKLKEELKSPAIEDNDLAKIIEQRFSHIYPYKSASGVPSKLTVTEIKKINTPEALYKVPILIEHPKFTESRKHFTAAERGSIVHFVMQHLDLKGVGGEDEIADQLKEMTRLELLTPEEAAATDIATIAKFYKSETGRRIISADPLWRELPFNYKKEASEVIDGLDIEGETLLIQGVIDCCFVEDGKWVLIDYKTDWIANESDIDRAVNNYRVQLELYSEALERLSDKPVGERILYLLNIGRAISI